MKIRFILMLALLLSGSYIAADAQSRGRSPQNREMPTPEQITEHVTASMVKNLALDDKTAAEFSTVYKAYLADKMKLRGEYKNIWVGKDDSDAQVEEKILRGFEYQQKSLDLQKEYYDRFRKVIGPKQIQKVYMSERMGGSPQYGNNGSGHGQRGPQPQRPR